MRCFPLFAIVVVLLTSSAISSLAAQSTSLKAFGHEIEIIGKYPVEKLIVDGREIHSDAIISIEEVATVGGFEVIIGHTSGGGNVCEGSHFVISFPPGEPARFDGPLDTCHIVTYSIQGATITFEEQHFRRIATRYDKLGDSFLAALKLVAVRLWLRHYESTT